MKLITVALVAAFMAAFFMPAARAESCKASYYWQGQRTATGAKYNPLGLTAAHKTMKFGTRVKVTYAGRSVVVTINDRGPYISGRCLDLSLGAARAIGLTGAGVGTVQYFIEG